MPSVHTVRLNLMLFVLRVCVCVFVCVPVGSGGDVEVSTLQSGSREEGLTAQESVEQSVATLMGEIGKHIEGQFQAVAAAAAAAGGSGQGVPVTSTATSVGDEPEKGMYLDPRKGACM